MHIAIPTTHTQLIIVSQCAKCKKNTSVTFEDGIYAPPLECDDENCKNKVLELQRAASSMTDYQVRLYMWLTYLLTYSLCSLACVPQVLRLQEALLDDDSARLPRTFDVECRGDVVNQVSV